ncbi:MAG: segregation and condensation protein A [Saccharofermentanales bacterium]|jgi:segregation and condensation protein A|nr:segregation/condensation protein A [Bacillota bacterium]
MSQFLTVNISEYDSPLDLIYHLIEVSDIDIYDIPIADITEQYFMVIKNSSLEELDMELASEFLVMAATLMQIKSRMLLPDQNADSQGDDFSDPREELVLRLLAYRRNKQLAIYLEDNLTSFQGAQTKMSASAKSLGLSIELIEDKISSEAFDNAVRSIVQKNKLRFSDQNQRIRSLLRREKFSVRDKMVEIINRVFTKTRMFFNELFPTARTSKAERVSGFLAILELIRQDKLTVKQSNPFAVMMIELDSDLKHEMENGQLITENSNNGEGEVNE